MYNRLLHPRGSIPLRDANFNKVIMDHIVVDSSVYGVYVLTYIGCFDLTAIEPNCKWQPLPYNVSHKVMPSNSPDAVEYTAGTKYQYVHVWIAIQAHNILVNPAQMSIQCYREYMDRVGHCLISK